MKPDGGREIRRLPLALCEPRSPEPSSADEQATTRRLEVFERVRSSDAPVTFYGCRGARCENPTVDVKIAAFRQLCASPEAQNHLVPMTRPRPADLRSLSGFADALARTGRGQCAHSTRTVRKQLGPHTGISPRGVLNSPHEQISTFETGLQYKGET